MPRSVFTPAYRQLIDQLVALRKSSKVTQAELATRLGKPQPWVSNYEGCIRRLDVIEFIAIIQALQCEPSAEFDRFVKALDGPVEI